MDGKKVYVICASISHNETSIRVFTRVKVADKSFLSVEIRQSVCAMLYESVLLLLLCTSGLGSVGDCDDPEVCPQDWAYQHR